MKLFKCFTKDWGHPKYIKAESRWDAMNTYELTTGFRCYSAIRMRNS